MLRKVDKTIVLPIYYSLYHDENVIVNTLLYAQLLYEIISFCFDLQILLPLITPSIRVHGTRVSTKSAGSDKKSTNRVGICTRSFLKNNNAQKTKDLNNANPTKKRG
jgi:hypothetical protein